MSSLRINTAGIAFGLLLTNSVLAATTINWNLVVMNRDNQQPLQDVPVHCTFTDNNNGRKTQGSCTTDPAGRCSIKSIAKSVFLGSPSQNANCTPVAAGFAREFDYRSRKVGDATEITFKLVPGPVGDRYKPEFYIQDIKAIDDDLDVVAKLVSPSIQTNGADLTVRSFINKQSGKTEFQLYAVITYRSERARRYNLASGATKRGPVPLEVTPIDYQPNCRGATYGENLCMHSETLGVDITDLMPELVTSMSYEEERKWRMRFSAKSGNTLDAEIPIAFFAAINEATILHKKKITQLSK